MDPLKFFKYPKSTAQKQYEALRAFYIDKVPGKDVARRFSYTYTAFNTLKQRFKVGQLNLFAHPTPGPKGPRLEPETKEAIINYRKKRLSAYQIAEVLDNMSKPVSVSTINRILSKEGFQKLPRRTQLKIGLTKDNTIVPNYAESLRPMYLDGWEGECAVGGIFLFAPLLEHYGLPSLIKKAKLPKSPKISALNYTLSMLALKLVGKERLSQINDFNFDKGFGLFSGLNVLPKSTAISTYSFRLSQRVINNLMHLFVQKQQKIKTYCSDTINLDFHTIQHYGDESVLEEHWAGARSKRVKGALTLIAQDCDSRCQVFVKTDILKKEADNQILEFVKFWKKIRGNFRQMLVFDSKLTTYKNLALLDDDNIKFISLRRRGKKLLEEAESIPSSEWKKVRIDSPKRKFKNPMINDSMTHLEQYGEIRQIIMKGNGREEPAFFITNDLKSKASQIVLRYSQRWRVENSIEEAVSFFNLNSLSSPILIKIHFDVLLTMIADTLYYHLAQNLRGFEHCDANKIFRHFIDMPAKIKVGSDKISIQYPLRSHSPVLRSAGLDKWAPPISWLGNRKLVFKWG